VPVEIPNPNLTFPSSPKHEEANNPATVKQMTIEKRFLRSKIFLEVFFMNSSPRVAMIEER
jgi:hypothetical protein